MTKGLRMKFKALIVLLPILAIVVQTEVKACSLTAEEIYLVAQVTTAEAENQCIIGQRYVIDTILNRIDDSGLSASEIVNAPNQYSKARPKASQEMIKLVIQEASDRTNDEVYYFRTNRYHGFGTPIIQIQDHYFSGK